MPGRRVEMTAKSPLTGRIEKPDQAASNIAASHPDTHDGADHTDPGENHDPGSRWHHGDLTRTPRLENGLSEIVAKAGSKSASFRRGTDNTVKPKNAATGLVFSPTLPLSQHCRGSTARQREVNLRMASLNHIGMLFGTELTQWGQQDGRWRHDEGYRIRCLWARRSMPHSHGASGQATLNSVKQKGFLTCGSSSGSIGFGIPDAQGNWTGLDVDLCRAIAAAIFDDPTKVRFIPLISRTVSPRSRRARWTCCPATRP